MQGWGDGSFPIRKYVCMQADDVDDDDYDGRSDELRLHFIVLRRKRLSKGNFPTRRFAILELQQLFLQTA